MRLKILLLIMFTSLALCSCIKEQTEDCDVLENLELIFTYNDAPDIAFADVITSVDVFLFNAQGNYYIQRRAEYNELLSSLSMYFTVPAGIYYIVGWGNVLSHSRFSDFIPNITTFEEGFVEIVSSVTDTGDPVYYSPYTEKNGTRASALTRDDHLLLYQVDVPSGKKTTKYMDFVRGHRTINVWVKGYTEIVEGVALHPDITVTQRWSKYDFFFTPSIRRDYKQQSHIETVDGTDFDEATFHNALGEIDDNIEVILTSPDDDDHILTIGLARFVAENNIIDTEEIDILITFLLDMGVTVTVPIWSETPIKPGV